MFDLNYIAVPVAIFFGFLMLAAYLKVWRTGLTDEQSTAMLIMIIIETAAISIIIL